MDPLTIMALSAGVQALTSGYRNIKAQKGLRELEKQRLPRYMDAAAPIQENKSMYQQMAKFGMGPASLNLARNQFAAGQNALTGTPVSGQLRTQLGRVASVNAGNFANQLAAQNEGIRRQAIGGVAQANLGLSGLQQRDIGFDLQRRTQAEQAYGQAIQDSRREMIGAATGLATGYLGAQNAEANRQLYRDMYGLNQKTQTPASAFNPVFAPGTFPAPSVPGKVAGPQTFNQYLTAGVPTGTTTDGMSSFAPGYQAPPSPMQTPFSAPSSTPPLDLNVLGQSLQGAQLRPTPIPPPSFNRFNITPSGNAAAMSVPNTMAQPFRFPDTSGDAFSQSVYNPNVLRFSNPYNMNRGFMDSYDAVRGPYGQIMFKPN